MASKKLSFSNISTVLFFLFALLMFISPDAKALVITGLMKIGFFQPDVEAVMPGSSTAIPAGIQFTDSTGKLVGLSELEGKVVFINFWATWCPPCRAEMPSIENLYQKMGGNKNIIFLMVDVDGEPEKAKAFMDRRKFALPVYTLASSVPESLLSGAIPTTLIINKKQQLVFRHEGAGNFGNKKTIDYLNKLSNE